MATPKLALIPTGYKAGKLYSVLPESGVGDFTVVRATEATRVNEEGLIETMGANVPRLDYSGGGCPVLLTEPQRTNILLYSESFDNAYWNKFGSSVASGFTSPDGASNAYKLVEDSANTQHGLLRSNFPINVQRTLSVFAKKGENDRVFISDYNKFGATIGVIFNLSSGIVESNQNDSIYLNPKIEPYLNGWYRCSVTWTNTTGLTVPFFGNAISGTNSYQGDGVSGIYVFGATFEEENYATSYIKTEGSAVTRNGDQVYGAGDAATFNDSEGVLMLEASALANDGTNRFLGISDGSLSNRVNIVYNASNGLIAQIQGAGSLTADSVNILLFNKSALKYKSGDNQFWVNGFKVDFNTSTSGATVGLDVLDLEAGNGSFDFYGNTSQIQYFNTALTDSELETLTSWASFIEMAQAQNYNII